MQSICITNLERYNWNMCGRYGFTIKDDREFLDRFDIESVDFELRESWNVAPTQEMPVIEKHSPNSAHLRKWGVQPAWSKMFLINAQAEKLSTSSVWKRAFVESRCIVPATYFFEWKRLSDGKQPYLIKLKHQDLFGFAGLVVKYHDDKKEEKEGYVIITTPPNELMDKIHNRMPAILKKEDEEAWLNPDNVEPDQLMSFLYPYKTSDMEAYPISSLVNTPKNNFPEIIKKLDY